MQVVIARNIAVQCGTNTLCVAHLAQNAAIGRGNALNSLNRAVGVKVHIHGGNAIQVHVLGGNLTVLSQLGNQFLRAQEAALAVRDRYIHNITHIHRGQPGRIVGGNSSSDDFGLVATNDDGNVFHIHSP